MSFNPGQKIIFLHEKGGGIVRQVLGVSKFLVEDEHGFERICIKNEIAPVHSTDFKIDETTISGLNADETFSTSKRATRVSLPAKGSEVWELDLHIESLTDSHTGWTNTDIVRKQLVELRSFFNRARSKRIRKLIIIHGVGTGVLKEEVRAFLQEQEGIEFYDADFREYGKGATAVEVRYNI